MTEAARPGFPAADAREQRPIELPDRRLFWRWVWEAVRPVLGWVLAALGAIALFLGWYGVSGESLTAKQLPYLVSGGLAGIALIIMAGVFLATDDVRRQLSRVADLERKVDDLYALFVADLSAPPAPAADSTPSRVLNPHTSGDRPAAATATTGERAATTETAATRDRADTTETAATRDRTAGGTDLVALPSGTSYHRPDCALVAGKDGAAPVDAATIQTRGLKPCRVCDPAPPASG